MNQYDFTLKYSLARSSADPGAYLENLAIAGCDDALVGIGNNGRIALGFTRNANSAREAMLTALADVKAAIPGAKLVEVDPDLVGLTDIAELLGFSRQNMRKLMIRSGPDFPAPVHAGKPAIWHLAKVLLWLRDKQTHEIDVALIEISRLSMQCNLLCEMTDLDPDIAHDFRALIA